MSLNAEAILPAVPRRPARRRTTIARWRNHPVLSLHRARQGFVKARTAQANQIRGLLGEYGLVIPKGIIHVTKRLAGILEDAENELPGVFRELLYRLGEHLKALDRQVVELEEQIVRWHRASPASKRLTQIPGIGPITANALVATIGNALQCKNARQLAAWVGLVPRQHSTGGKPMLLGISKRGDAYLRTLLIHGARSVVRVTEGKTDGIHGWLAQLVGRRHKDVAAVALANKNARTVWALLRKGEDYQSGYQRSVAG
ncbi:MAG: transposase [Gammaproteobacteria bacterium]|jgi:transposase